MCMGGVCLTWDHGIVVIEDLTAMIETASRVTGLKIDAVNEIIEE
jgi:hypothetical protein